jgi:hypothetical protein
MDTLPRQSLYGLAAEDHEQPHSRERRQEDRFATARSESVANAGTCPMKGPKIRATDGPSHERERELGETRALAVL